MYEVKNLTKSELREIKNIPIFQYGRYRADVSFQNGNQSGVNENVLWGQTKKYKPQKNPT